MENIFKPFIKKIKRIKTSEPHMSPVHLMSDPKCNIAPPPPPGPPGGPPPIPPPKCFRKLEE